ncbi:MAG: EAL domain-containing protein [Lachnospiraceae bacterium]|nr:EAL domain-containing protein [Lachnospiraceae bacterium]
MCKKRPYTLLITLSTFISLIAVTEFYSYYALKNMHEKPHDFLVISQLSAIFLILGCVVIIYIIWKFFSDLINCNSKDVTGIHNKKALENKFSEIAQRSDTMNVGMIMYDLNNFKHINDTYGHERGDKMIKDFTCCLSKIIIDGSFLARFGGDEFIIIQENATPELLKNMSLKLFRIVEDFNNCTDLKISYAEGYDVSYRNHYFLIEDLLNEVDKKMYRDKVYKKKITGDQQQQYDDKNDLGIEMFSEHMLASEIFSYIQSNTENNKLALVISDISNFHYFNNAFGYSVGNNVLKTIDHEIIGAPYVIFTHHLHSDVFASLLDITGYDENTLTSKIIWNNKKIINQVSSQNHVCRFMINSGIYIMESNYVAPEVMISNANAARRQAKLNNLHVCCYNNDLRESESREAKILLSFQDALKNDCFKIYFQPKVNASTGEICSAETLVRWLDNGKPVWSPDEFIPLLERTGYIVELDYLVYEKCFNFISKNKVMQQNDINFSLNVSPAHIHAPQEFIERVMTLAERYSIDLSRIIFEITESAFIHQKEQLNEMIDILHENNIRISMDDFGSGYSSLQRLGDINFDEVKIDKQFFRNGITDNTKIILHEIIDMLKKLNKTIVCEGVEEEEVVNFLRKEGCDEMQGFLFYKPMNEQEFTSVFSENYDEAAS